mmetsp:Transcript_22910/g.67497  ORF Transcript_22910/g.67497 Transcript_22910/m.67497 type:complete len:248 (-) Transcript_22910:627-1370(-)
MEDEDVVHADGHVLRAQGEERGLQGDFDAQGQLHEVRRLQRPGHGLHGDLLQGREVGVTAAARGTQARQAGEETVEVPGVRSDREHGAVRRPAQAREVPRLPRHLGVLAVDLAPVVGHQVADHDVPRRARGHAVDSRGEGEVHEAALVRLDGHLLLAHLGGVGGHDHHEARLEADEQVHGLEPAVGDNGAVLGLEGELDGVGRILDVVEQEGLAVHHRRHHGLLAVVNAAGVEAVRLGGGEAHLRWL